MSTIIAIGSFAIGIIVIWYMFAIAILLLLSPTFWKGVGILAVISIIGIIGVKSANADSIEFGYIGKFMNNEDERITIQWLTVNLDA